MHQQLKKIPLFLILFFGCTNAYGISAFFNVAFNEGFSNPHLFIHMQQAPYGAQVNYGNDWQINPYIAPNAFTVDNKKDITQQAIGAFLAHATVYGVFHLIHRAIHSQKEQLPLLQNRIERITQENKKIAQKLFDAHADQEFITQWKELIETTPSQDRISLIHDLKNDIADFPSAADELEKLKQTILL